MDEKVIFRTMKGDDLDAVCEIERLSFKNPWTKEAFSFELNENPFSFSYIAEMDEQIIGYAFIHIADDFSHLVNIAISPDYRNIGIGEKFLRFLIGLVKELKSPKVVLEVRKNNISAIRLYEKLGFESVREEKGYYQDGESALVMFLDLKLDG
jgi:ribosomal-protein-alanine N-acetyltransferase